MHLRDGTTADHEFLLELLLAAFNWTGETRVTREQMLADPNTERYLGGWLRHGDFGVIAEAARLAPRGGVEGPDVEGPPDETGDTDRPDQQIRRVGALWARALPCEEAGYGYVADDVPEIGMAVVAEYRGQGIGSALLAAGVSRARIAGWRGLSLSVEDGNVAARSLYQRHGFVVVGRNGQSDTMLLDL